MVLEYSALEILSNLAIGASDSHTGAGAYSEEDYWSKIGIIDGTLKDEVVFP